MYTLEPGHGDTISGNEGEESPIGLGVPLFFRGLGLSDADLNIVDTAQGAEIIVASYGTLILEGLTAADLAPDDFDF